MSAWGFVRVFLSADRLWAQNGLVVQINFLFMFATSVCKSRLFIELVRLCILVTIYDRIACDDTTLCRPAVRV